MKAKYKKIEFGFGKIDDAVKQLQKHKEKGEKQSKRENFGKKY